MMPDFFNRRLVAELQYRLNNATAEVERLRAEVSGIKSREAELLSHIDRLSAPNKTLTDLIALAEAKARYEARVNTPPKGHSVRW